MPTPREIRRDADRLESDGRAAIAEAKRLRRLAAQIERLEAAVSNPLTSSRDEHKVSRGTLATEFVTEGAMRARRPPPQASTRLAIGAKNTTRVCLFSDWLTATDQTATSWALDSRHADAVSGKPCWAPSAVRAWMLDPGKKSARKVPYDAAMLIAAESKGAVPADDAAWPNGISRPRSRIAS